MFSHTFIFSWYYSPQILDKEPTESSNQSVGLSSALLVYSWILVWCSVSCGYILFFCSYSIYSILASNFLTLSHLDKISSLLFSSLLFSFPFLLIPSLLFLCIFFSFPLLSLLFHSLLFFLILSCCLCLSCVIFLFLLCSVFLFYSFQLIFILVSSCPFPFQFLFPNLFFLHSFYSVFLSSIFILLIVCLHMTFPMFSLLIWTHLLCCV